MVVYLWPIDNPQPAAENSVSITLVFPPHREPTKQRLLLSRKNTHHGWPTLPNRNFMTAKMDPSGCHKSGALTRIHKAFICTFLLVWGLSFMYRFGRLSKTTTHLLHTEKELCVATKVVGAWQVRRKTSKGSLLSPFRAAGLANADSSFQGKGTGMSRRC